MVVSAVLFVLIVGSITAAPVVEVEDGWTEIVSAGAKVVGGVVTVAEDVFKIIADVKGKRELQREVQDGWTEIVSAGAKVVGGVVTVAEDVFKIIVDVKGKRELQDDVITDLVTGATGFTDLIKEIETLIQTLIKDKREVQDANWAALVADGAKTVQDVIDLGKSIGDLVNAVKNGKREVQDANWLALVADGAKTVQDVIDLGKSIGDLVNAVKNGKK